MLHNLPASDTLFGTDGIRGRVGSFALTPHDLIFIGQAIARWTIDTYGENQKILIGTDTRISCALLKAALKVGLLSFPVTVLDAGIIPTPVINALLKHHADFTLGIMLSASHNPYHDNGIKIIDATGDKLNDHHQHIISQHFHALRQQNNPTYCYDFLGSDNHFPPTHKLYGDILLRYFSPQFLRGITVLIDTAHGASYMLAPALFEQFGATVIPLNNAPNGTNINDACGSLFSDNLSLAMTTHKADIGFALDGDGDRLIVANKTGMTIDGDGILALLCEHPDYKIHTSVVGTVMSNHALSLFLQEKNRALLRSPVGDSQVVKLLQQHDLLLGGEPSGHIIMRDYLNASDGIFTALKLLETIIYTGNWFLGTYTPFSQTTINIPVTSKKDLSEDSLATIIKTYQSYLPSGRIIVRYSGTEPLLRIMVEDVEPEKVHTISNALATELRYELR